MRKREEEREKENKADMDTEEGDRRCGTKERELQGEKGRP